MAAALRDTMSSRRTARLLIALREMRRVASGAGTVIVFMRDCREELAEFIAPDGTTRVPIEGHIVAAQPA